MLRNFFSFNILVKQNLSAYANTAVYIVDYYYQIIIMTPICRTGEILTLCHLYFCRFLMALEGLL